LQTREVAERRVCGRRRPPSCGGMPMPERLVVVDAFAHVFQFFYAIKGLTGPDGEPVNALYGFARLIHRLREAWRPDYLVVAFDGPGELLRHQAYDEYKANRPPMPEALERQIPLIGQLLEAHGIPRVEAAGYEADDVIATLAQMAAERAISTVIVTTDKDAEQLISDHTVVLHIRRDSEELLDAAALAEAKGIEPWQVVEVMALAGDSTDNVPGVPGVGPKTALKLIGQFGSVEELYTHLDEVATPKLREKLEAHRTDVDLARRLVTLCRSVPIQEAWDRWRDDGGDPEGLDTFYRAVGFHSLRGDAPPAPTQSKLFAGAEEPRTIDSGDKDYRAVRTLEDLEELVAVLPGLDVICVDLETTSLQPRDASIVGVALSWQPDQAVYVATDGPPGSEVCALQDALALLRPVFESPMPRKRGQNLKYDIAVLRNYGMALNGIDCDSMVASYLLHPSGRSHGLDALARRHLNYETIKIADLIGRGRDQLTMDRVPVEQVARYACEDADIALRLCNGLVEDLRKEGLDKLFRGLEVPLVPVLADMEWTGIRVDTQVLGRLGAEFAEKLEEAAQRVYAEAGEEINLNSPRQLSTVLFERMKLPAPAGSRRTTGYSTASSVLEGLKGAHPIAAHVLEYRELSKLKGTYADALLGMVNEATGRIHASFNQTVTATGRLSSSDPNLQNIPVRTPLGRRIRSAFVAGRADMSLVSADYSQVELRIMAHCSGDRALRKAFAEDRDIHRFVAAQVNGVPEDEVTPLMRQRAKAVNFGIIYGLSPYGLSRQLGLPVPEAERFIEDYFARYPEVRQFIGRTVDRARRDGFVTTLAGRKRTIEGIRSTGATRSAAERIAVNTVIQGSAADLIKKAMIEIHAGLPDVSRDARLLLQIHDELVLEAPDAELGAVCGFVAARMGEAAELEVPLRVDTATGKNWAEVK
jgi:DNA polymerase-1